MVKFGPETTPAFVAAWEASQALTPEERGALACHLQEQLSAGLERAELIQVIGEAVGQLPMEQTEDLVVSLCLMLRRDPTSAGLVARLHAALSTRMLSSLGRPTGKDRPAHRPLFL